MADTVALALHARAIADALRTRDERRPVGKIAAASPTRRAPDTVEPIGSVAIAVALVAHVDQVLDQHAPIALTARALSSAGAFLALDEG